MSDSLSNFSYWFALVLSVGSLLFYLSGAIWNREVGARTDDARYEFNLGVPASDDQERLFSITLVAAGTSLSTVFVFFLTASAKFGYWVLLAPLLFAIGNWVMFRVYKGTAKCGYFTEQGGAFKGAAGLVPYLGERLTGSQTVGWLLVFISLLNLFAVLVLELTVGAEVFGYLSRHTFHTGESSVGEFVVFAVSIVLLLGYVFVGGFRAVVASDVWQMKAMKSAIIIAIVSIAIYGVRSTGSTIQPISLNASLPFPVLAGFITNITLANLFVPFSQEASWQRFRAFGSRSEFNAKRAITLSLLTATGLWLGLIVLSFGLILVLPNRGTNLTSISAVLEAFRTLNDWWFPLFVFPTMTVAGLSAMYSTADTSVSALLYLIEYSRPRRAANESENASSQLPTTYYAAMLLVLLVSIGVYSFVRIWFSPTILQLIFSVFSNLVVVAPTVISTTILRPFSEDIRDASTRRWYVIASLVTGFVLYWTCAAAAIVLGERYLWLSQVSIVLGILGAALPLVPLWLRRSGQLKPTGG